jgi:integrase
LSKKKLKKGRISWGYIFDVSRDQNGRRRQVMRKGFSTKHEAEDALRTAIGDHEKGRGIKKDPQMFEMFFKTWLEQHGAAHWGKMTAEQNDKRATYAIRKFGDVPVQKLTSMRLEQDFGALLAKGCRDG